MHITQPTLPDPRDLFRLLRVHARLWLVPAAAIAVVVGVYAVAHRATWEASQALIVRNEASNAERTPGKFSGADEMKTVQETILEVARSRSVLEAALSAVGPAADHDAEHWPSERDVADLRDDVKLVPPKAAEFGKTEVFYLNVRATDRARSVALNEAICKQLQARFQELRDAKARSVVEELTKTVALAKAELDRATTALAATENGVGSDLAELRSMQDAATSDSALRRSGEEIRAQLRDNALAENTNRELLKVLAETNGDPGRFVATPNRLLDAHPSLRRLKDGLVDAQLRTSALLGTMSAKHPKVIAARECEDEIGRNLCDELLIARRGVQVELRALAGRRSLLETQLAQTNERLQSLAAVRAGYANKTSEVKSRASLLDRAEQNLADARGSLASAKAASLISRIDAPDAGIHPIGPSRLAIALGGVFGGLLAGIGVLFLAVPVGVPAVAADAAHAPVAASANGSRKPKIATVPCGNGDGHLSIQQALRTLVSSRI